MRSLRMSLYRLFPLQPLGNRKKTIESVTLIVLLGRPQTTKEW